MRPADNHVSSVSSRSPGISGLVLLLLFLFLLLALPCSVQCVASAGVALCPANEEAMAAMRAADNVSVSYTRGIGYSFVNTANSVTIPFTPGIPYSFVNTGVENITLGMVILPELGVAPEAYAVYARRKLTAKFLFVCLSLLSRVQSLFLTRTSVMLFLAATTRVSTLSPKRGLSWSHSTVTPCSPVGRNYCMMFS